MLPQVRSPLGLPGVFALPARTPPALHPQRMDVCGFAGVAPRGPAREPVADAEWPGGYRRVLDDGRPCRRSIALAVRSFDEYQRHFGGFDGPGLLPHAVSAWFEQGGQLAWVVRIVHDRAARFDDGCARTEVAGVFSVPVGFIARNEGSWGSRIRVRLALHSTPQAFQWTAGHLDTPANAPLPAGSTLRLTENDGSQHLALVTDLRRIRDPLAARHHWRLTLDVAPAVAPLRLELIRASIEIDDGAGWVERFDHLALAPEHADYLASVLCDRSQLLWPDPGWAGTRLLPAATRVESLHASARLGGGLDDWSGLQADDFFDPHWTPADEAAGDGITAFAHNGQVTQLVVPDLYLPAQWAGEETMDIVSGRSAGAEFGECADTLQVQAATTTPPLALTGLMLDPRTSAGLESITALQLRVVDFCEQTRDHIALLDVPPGLSQGRIEQWRARFDSPWAAAYHPWLVPARRHDGQSGQALRPLPPCVVAAGIIARREFERGIQYGPANAIAREVIHLAETQPEGRADALHPLGINCYARQPEGIVLTAARTLSHDPDWRQLSVRRMMLMLRRALLVHTQWAVFEPNGPPLWRELQRSIESLLRGLFRAGAFAGASEAESFFVRIHNDARLQAAGQLQVDIGVAPAEPLEFILVRLRRDGDGTLSLED